MANSESVGKKIVEALKKQADNIETVDSSPFDTDDTTNKSDDIFGPEETSDVFAEQSMNININKQKNASFFDDIPNTSSEPFFIEQPAQQQAQDSVSENFEMPANIAVLRRLISQLPSGVSRHTGAQIIKQTMEALGISMKSVLQDAQQVQEGLKVSARECQASIQEYKKQILALEKQSQSYQKQYSALNDLISLFIQTTK